MPSIAPRAPGALRVALLDANDLLTQLRKPVRERVQPARQLPQLVELRQISTLQTARDSDSAALIWLDALTNWPDEPLSLFNP